MEMESEFYYQFCLYDIASFITFTPIIRKNYWLIQNQFIHFVMDIINT